VNILVAVLTIAALLCGVAVWRSQVPLLRRGLTVAVIVPAAYLVAWVGAGTGRLPASWVTDHPIAVIGIWALAVLAVFGPVTVSRFRMPGRRSFSSGS
jgi:hypothetical protein